MANRNESADDLEGADIWGDAPDPHKKKKDDMDSSSSSKSGKNITGNKRSVDELIHDAEDLILEDEVRGMSTSE
eukprot:CAMPEP_0185736940 /NCGR_PEP_ID=MMETSP1171-20130828/29229_1 /TAXON_ID=374046 /ORGANISM="Helicotheca tamensis, Strain CCMP826" /LENGTH=73 /DNA_ID=CAMNT_0028407713 /DNA_START=37 /DNA_END=255 /DNA_ORIENTATION=-